MRVKKTLDFRAFVRAASAFSLRTVTPDPLLSPPERPIRAETPQR